jgi:hypothetical protein
VSSAAIDKTFLPDDASLFFRQDIYVAVVGTLKSFNQKRHVSATTVRPITDMNEVHYHFLECVYVSLSARNPGMVSGNWLLALSSPNDIFCALTAGRRRHNGSERWRERIVCSRCRSTASRERPMGRFRASGEEYHGSCQ